MFFLRALCETDNDYVIKFSINVVPISRPRPVKRDRVQRSWDVMYVVAFDKFHERNSREITGESLIYEERHIEFATFFK